MAARGQQSELTVLTFKVRPEFARALDALANRRGLSRSAFLRELVKEEAINIASADQPEDGSKCPRD